MERDFIRDNFRKKEVGTKYKNVSDDMVDHYIYEKNANDVKRKEVNKFKNILLYFQRNVLYL